MNKILVIEDEPKVARFIQKGLAAEGYSVDLAESGDDGLRMAASCDYDLITIDMMLPGLSGVSLIRSLRALSQRTAILVVSALGNTQERVAGLQAGADDYLPKPFDFEELVARIKALLRRTAQHETSSQLTYADIVLNLERRSAMRAGREIALTQKEFALLELLVRNAERVVSRQKISSLVWNEQFDRDSNVIDVYMMYLRKKLELTPDSKLIHTVRGAGYMLEARDPG